jgi:FMNH2-dependent dimethyl sulfone monooxygenase
MNGRPKRRFGANAFELGIFSSNVQNGMAQLKAELWDASWENNLNLARLAEEAGLEFMLPLGRWRPGARNVPMMAPDAGGAWETLVWAAGLLASTNRIAVFGTLHVAYVNPVFAAKQVVTAHHIGRGRFGLNVVSGTVPEDFAMFGLVPGDHDSQYDYTDEWVAVAKRIWTEWEPFDHTGTYFTLRGVRENPKPYGGQLPMLISAGASQRGRTFAMQHADALFTMLTEVENAAGEVKSARAYSEDGERVPIYCSSHLVCRPTRKEAEEYYHYLAYELGEWAGIEEAASRRMKNAGSVPYISVQRLKERMVTGLGTLLALGSYDDVAQTYKQLHDAGLDGSAIGLIDYKDDFLALRDEVLPRLERLGVRGKALQTS